MSYIRYTRRPSTRAASVTEKTWASSAFRKSDRETRIVERPWLPLLQPRQRDLHMALQAVSEAIEKLAATDGLEARRDALALLLDTCESCYGKDAVALGNVMRSNEGRGLRVLCELLVSAKNADDEVLRQQALLVIGNLASDALDTQSSLTKGLLMQLAAHKALLHCLEASDEVTLGLACGALQNLCHDRAWSSWLLQHGAERRLEELSRSSDPTIQRYASGTLMNVSSSTHATLAGGAQAAVAQRLHDAAVESFTYARAGRTIGRAVAAIPAKARMQRIMAAQQHSSRRRTPSALLQTADSHALATAAAPRQRATGEQAAAAATLEKAAAERAAAAAEGAAATTPAAQQKAAAEQAAADGRTVSEEAAAIRVQAIVRGNADRQTAAAEAAAEVAAQAAAAAVAEARLLAREERRRASAAAAAAAAAAATRAAIRMQARIRGNAGRDRAAAAQRRREAEVAAAAARQRAAEEQAAAEKAATEKAAAAARAQAAAATRVQARARGNADRGVATKRRQAAEAAAAVARQRAAEEAGAAAVAAAAAAAAATKVQAIQRGCSVRAALPQRIAILVPLVKKAILVARAEAEAEALAAAKEAEADALAAAKEVEAEAAAIALVTSLLAEEAAANQTASTDESGEIAQVTAEGAAKVHVEAWATAQEVDSALEIENFERLAATAVVTAMVTAAVTAVSEAVVAAAEAAMRVADVAADAAEAEAAAAAAAAEAEAEAEEAAKVASVAAADAEAAEAAAAKAGKEAKAVAEAAASRAREAAEAAAEAATRRATGAAEAAAAAARAAAEAVAAREAERAATEEVARREAEEAADADAAALELATSLLAEEVAAKEAAAESVSPLSVSQGKPAKYNSRVQPPAWLIEAWAEQEAAEAAAAAQAAAAERAAQQRATAAANAAAAAKAAYYNSGGAMVDAAVGAPAPGATNRAAALARRREAAPPPMARATADIAPLYARRQAPPQSTSAPPSVFHDGASIYFNQNQRLLQYEPVRSKASGQAGRVARAVAGVPILAVFDQSVVAAPAPPPPVPFLPPIPTRGAVAGADGLLDGWSEAKGSPRQPVAPLSVEGLRGDAKGGNRVARARRYEALAAVGDDVASRIERKATRAIRRAADADAVGDAESVSQLEVLPHHHYYHHQQQRQRQPDHTLLPDIRLIPTIRVPIHPYHSCYRSGMKQIVGMRYHLCQDECDKLNASAEALGKQTRSSYDLCEDEYDKLNAAEKRNYEMIPPTICVDAGPIDNDELVGLASHKHRRARKSEVVRAAERAAANRLLYPGLAGGGAMGAPPHPSV